MRVLNRKSNVKAMVQIPGSKSLTHRALITAALSLGDSQIINPSHCQDTLTTKKALEALGCEIVGSENSILVRGGSIFQSQTIEPCIDLQESGTSFRLILAVCGLRPTWSHLYGGSRLSKRPIKPLIEALSSLGAHIRWHGPAGHLPLSIKGGNLKGGIVELEAYESSQYVSALMLVGPLLPKGLVIRLKGGIRSRPYIKMTAHVMEHFGASCFLGEKEITIPPKGPYTPGAYWVEPDATNASYFLGLPMLVGGRIGVAGLKPHSHQGDIRFLEILKEMGGSYTHTSEGIWTEGNELKGLELDMGDVPDLVPTVAALAAFAEGTTVIKNVPHLKIKESDRIQSICLEWKSLGLDVRPLEDGLVLKGSETYRPNRVFSHNDHRIAMALALLGSKQGDIVLEGEGAVKKSFPNFWELWDQT